MKSRSDHSSMLLKSRWHETAYWGLLALAGILFLIMNTLTTLKEDDMAFSLIEGSWVPIHSLLDALRSHCNHFIDANGRTANLVATLFCGLLGKTVFNICNTLVFCLMAHLMSVLSTGRRSLMALALFLAVVGTCYPVPGETMLWLDGSCNYMWAITISLVLTRYLQCDHSKPLRWAYAPFLLLAAFVAGSFNEATSFGFFAGWCLYFACHRQQFNRRVAIVLGGYLLGIILIVTSPGAWDRAADGGIVTNLGFQELLSSRWYIFQEKMWRFYLPVAVLITGIVAMAWKGPRVVWRCIWTYIFLCLVLVMLALGIIHERAYAPLVSVSLILVTMAIHALLDKQPWPRLAVTVACLALATFTWARGIKMLQLYKTYDDNTVAEIVQAPGQAILQERSFPGYSRFVKPMNYRSTDFFGHEVIYCAYYGKDNVQFVDDSVYTRYHSGRLLDGATARPMTTEPADAVVAVMTFPDQNYMAIILDTDTMPHTPQTARYYMSQPASGLTTSEKERRSNYGLVTEYNPKGFYPIHYQGKYLLIAPLPDNTTASMVFPMEYASSPKELTIIPKQ